ncbi:DUF21 domain-containing protein [Streptomyces sp. AJS327]|uniref:CNNM domain-containing protein n=1 Tax=Streptomyces sp. AJS327 TaxID=2545265 RepID=UPI0015DF3310|nr:CNNM domain-containing protein [Streptomyces sp. AJS327]MBA0050624.1 DUF21 domain-containing protein [Streptomyces sp. AJS327]
MTATHLGLSLATLAGTAFLVAAAFATASVRRGAIETQAEAGSGRARGVLRGLERLPGLMATARLGVTLAPLVLGAVAVPAVARLLEPGFEAAGTPPWLPRPAACLLALAAVAYLHTLVGELLPRNLALAAPRPLALALGPGLVALARVARPVVTAVRAPARSVRRPPGAESGGEGGAVCTGRDLSALVRGSSEAGLLPGGSGERACEALELGGHTVDEVMLSPRRTVTADHRTTPERLEWLAVRHGYSRFPVVGPDGAMLGYLHVKDALDDTLPPGRPFPRSALRALPRVRAGTALDAALTVMCAAVAHLAVVEDARGAVLGLLTMEDVLAELVGPVTEEAAAR